MLSKSILSLRLGPRPSHPYPHFHKTILFIDNILEEEEKRSSLCDPAENLWMGLVLVVLLLPWMGLLQSHVGLLDVFFCTVGCLSAFLFPHHTKFFSLSLLGEPQTLYHSFSQDVTHPNNTQTITQGYREDGKTDTDTLQNIMSLFPLKSNPYYINFHLSNQDNSPSPKNRFLRHLFSSEASELSFEINSTMWISSGNFLSLSIRPTGSRFSFSQLVVSRMNKELEISALASEEHQNHGFISFYLRK